MHPVQPIQRKIPWFFGVVFALLLAVCGGGCRTTPGFTFLPLAHQPQHGPGF